MKDVLCTRCLKSNGARIETLDQSGINFGYSGRYVNTLIIYGQVRLNPWNGVVNSASRVADARFAINQKPSIADGGMVSSQEHLLVIFY